MLFANEGTRNGRFYNKTLKDIDQRDHGSSDDDMELQDSQVQGERPSDAEEDSDSERKHKVPFEPPEDIDLGDDQWTLRNVKADRDLGNSDSELDSDPESESDDVVLQDDLDADKTVESVPEDVSTGTRTSHLLISLKFPLQESESDEKEPRFVPENPPAATPREREVSPVADLANGHNSLRSPVAAPEATIANQASSSPPSSCKQATPPDKMGESGTDNQYDETRVSIHPPSVELSLTLSRHVQVLPSSVCTVTASFHCI